MAIEVYLFFDGNCRKTVEFYANAFNTGKPLFMTYEEGHENDPSKLPEEAKDRIMHANLNIGGSRLMFSDVFPGTPFTIGNNMTIAFIHDDVDYMKSAFEKLKEGGKVEMELQETFFSKCYGSLIDQFGVHWQFSHENKE